MKRFSGAMAVAVALALCLAAVGCTGETGAEGNAITVSASATAQIVPDRGEIGISASASGNTADEAKAAGEAKADDIIDALRALGVSDEGLSDPEVTVSERTSSEVIETSEIVDGYEDEWGNWVDVYDTVVHENAVTTYDAAVHLVASFPADQLGQLVRDAAAVGATGFDGLSFTVSDHDAAYQQALSEAVDAAHAKAESLADASGVFVGRLVNLEEKSDATFEDTVAGNAGKLDPNDDSTLDVEPDAIPVEASVTVSYAIS